MPLMPWLSRWSDVPLTLTRAHDFTAGRCRSGVVRCFSHTSLSHNIDLSCHIMSLLARTPAALRLRTPQIIHSRAIVPSRGVHGYKVCVPLDAIPNASCSLPAVAL
jgi:hypothetical protein